MKATPTKGGVPCARVVPSCSSQLAKAEACAPSAPASCDRTLAFLRFTSRHQRTLDELRRANRIYLDTCFLMNSGRKLFFRKYLKHLLRARIRLTVISLVEDELWWNKTMGSKQAQNEATDALDFIEAHREDGLLDFVTTDYDHPIADPIFCRLFMRGFLCENQILLTQDKNLSSAIFNLCCCRESGCGFVTQVLSVGTNGELWRRNPEQLELSHRARLPFCMIGDFCAPTAAPVQKDAYETMIHPPVQSHEEYLAEAVTNGITFMSRCALEQLFEAEEPAFLRRFDALWQAEPGLTIRVLASSLTPELLSGISRWRHLFTIMRPADWHMNEEEALLAAMYTEPLEEKNALHYLLICRDVQLVSNIASRKPRCFFSRSRWAACLTEDGFLNRILSLKVDAEPSSDGEVA